MLNSSHFAAALAFIVNWNDLASVLLSTIIFVALGLIVFAAAFFIIVRVVPFSVKKEIEEDQNISLAILIGSMILGISIIIAAAISGDSGSTPSGTSIPTNVQQNR